MSNLQRAAIVLLVLVLSRAATSQAAEAWTVETVAGNGQTGDSVDGQPAKETPVDQPFGVECGPDGALYLTTVGSHRVLRLDRKTGELTSVAGSGKSGYAGDGGQATEALLNEPYEVRFDKTWHYLFFVEMKNHLIRRVDLHTGLISTVAGRPESGYAGDGSSASEALFSSPHSIALDDAGNLYVADIGNHRIRRIDAATGTIASIAGNGEKKLPVDGSSAEGRPILGPRALFIVGNTMWIALREGNSIWRLDLESGTIQHVAGTGKKGFRGDGGDPKLATFDGPKGIVATRDDIVYVMDTENQAVRRIDTKAGRIDTVAGGGPKSRGFAGEGTSALEARFDRPHGICLDPAGSLFVGDTNNHRVRWVHP